MMLSVTRWLNQHKWLGNAISVFLIVTMSLLPFVGAVLALNYFAPLVETVQAAGGSDNCEVLGTIGSVIIGRCIDPDTGREIYGNSQGFIDAIEEY